MGSKNRLAKELIPIITKDLKPNQWYVEPFVGGANLIDKVQHPYKIGADCNRYLIALLQYVQAGGQLPEEITKEEHQKVKEYMDSYPDWYVGFVGFICSYSGRFMAGYVRNNVLKKSGKVEHYQKEHINNLLKQNLSDTTFIYSDYRSLDIPDNSVIYCDPPYSGTTGYKDAFDSEAFWDWCRQMKAKGHQIYISEYNAPLDFACIWQKDQNKNLGGTVQATVEKLFTL